MGDMLDLVG
jgi:hypothetical protein